MMSAENFLLTASRPDEEKQCQGSKTICLRQWQMVSSFYLKKKTTREMSPKAILLILGLSFSVDAFSSSLSLPRRQQSVFNRLKKSRLFYVPEEEEESSPISSFTSSWSLEQDWALIDQLPKFTVGEGSHIRTFWTQLLACTPILSEKSPDSLFRRCQELESIQEKNNNTTEAKASGRPIIFGPAPILLTNWQIDFDHLDGKAVGQTKDGRSIWLHYISLGRLEGDPFSDSSSSIFFFIPGGYLEAVGGRIYELGEPRSVQQTPESSIAVATARMNNDKEHKTTKPFDWWVPATTATVSALLASTILSACIGYGAGLSIISDGSHSTAQHSSTVVPPISSATNTMTQPIVNLGETTSSQPTISEQRARVEYRIIREQRLLKSISDKIERDQNELLKLRRIENSQ